MNNNENNTNNIQNNNTVQGVSELNQPVNTPTTINPLEVKREPEPVQVNPQPESQPAENTQNTTPAVEQVVPRVDPNQIAAQVKEPVANNGNDASNDNGAAVNEKLKKVEVNYTPPSRFKMVMLVLFFIALIAFVIFLPDINSMINKYKAGNQDGEKITSGVLKCTLQSNTSELDLDYLREFYFTNSKLEKAKFTLTTKGDPSLDADRLGEANQKCMALEKESEDLTGVEVSCKYSDGKLIESQTYEFQGIDNEKLDSAFTEAGGTKPEFSYGQNIDDIEKTMVSAGYTCVRNRQ